MPYCRVRLARLAWAERRRTGSPHRRPSRVAAAVALLVLLGLAMLLMPGAAAAASYEGVGQQGIVPHGDGGVDAKGARRLDGFTTILLRQVPAEVCDIVLRTGEGTNITLDPPATNLTHQRDRANDTLHQGYALYRDYVVDQVRKEVGDDEADGVNASFPANPFAPSGPPAIGVRSAAVYADAGRQGARFHVMAEWRYDANGNCTVEETAAGITYHDPSARPHVHLTLQELLQDFLVDRGETHEVAFTVNNEGTIPGHLSFTAGGQVVDWGFRWLPFDGSGPGAGEDETNGNGTDGNGTAGNETQAEGSQNLTATARIGPGENATFRFSVQVPEDAPVSTSTLRLGGDLQEDEATYPLQFTYKVRKPPEEQLRSPQTDEELVKRLAREAEKQMEKARAEREAAAVVEESPNVSVAFTATLLLVAMAGARRRGTVLRQDPSSGRVQDAASSDAASTPLPERSAMSCSRSPSIRRRRPAR